MHSWCNVRLRGKETINGHKMKAHDRYTEHVCNNWSRLINVLHEEMCNKEGQTVTVIDLRGLLAFYCDDRKENTRG